MGRICACCGRPDRVGPRLTRGLWSCAARPSLTIWTEREFDTLVDVTAR
jgi:hypothetical protein